MRRLAMVSSVVYALAAVACFPDARDDAFYSTPLGVNVKFDSKKIANGILSESKPMAMETGNPYALFIATARGRLGHDPSTIGVDRADLRLGGESVGVAVLGEVFAGTVEVLFDTLATGNSYPVASAPIDSETPAGPLDLAIAFEPSDIPDADYVHFLDAMFDVRVRGPVAPDFDKKAKALADLQITLQLVAYD